ncbi:Ethylene-insensitive protein 2 [Morella rubra]|uniref:Ethylene-insensitive protein 2 n=1 Tax=Morella rubra TaxID=262757 RepID=A0A6A1WLL0_9ROSI|nr:Ethylene-insensitive protein 2 [Morella rubra]
MEAASSNSNHLLDSLNRLLPAVVPVLLISVGYVDPGKWAATVEGGARFGFDLLPLMLVFNFAAILCQYLSARIGLVTGRDLAQICRDEYDKFTCLFLGVQIELSVIALDLTMENGKAKFLFICMSGFILLSVVLGVLISQTEISLSMNWMLPKLSGENAFALMSLLGANIMPHNFFLHSSIVQVSLPSIPAVTYP